MAQAPLMPCEHGVAFCWHCGENIDGDRPDEGTMAALNVGLLTAQIASLKAALDLKERERSEVQEIADAERKEAVRLQAQVTAAEERASVAEALAKSRLASWNEEAEGCIKAMHWWADRARELEKRLKRIDSANRQHEDAIKGANAFMRAIRDEVIAAFPPMDCPPQAHAPSECAKPVERCNHQHSLNSALLCRLPQGHEGWHLCDYGDVSAPPDDSDKPIHRETGVHRVPRQGEIDQLRADLAEANRKRDEAEAGAAAKHAALVTVRDWIKTDVNHATAMEVTLCELDKAIDVDAGRAFLERMRAAEHDAATFKATCDRMQSERDEARATLDLNTKRCERGHVMEFHGQGIYQCHGCRADQAEKALTKAEERNEKLTFLLSNADHRNDELQARAAELDQIRTDLLNRARKAEERALSAEEAGKKERLARLEAETENARMKIMSDMYEHVIAARVHPGTHTVVVAERDQYKAALGRAVALLERALVLLPKDERILKADIVDAITDSTCAAAGEYVRELEALYDCTKVYFTAEPLGVVESHAEEQVQQALAKVAARRGA